MDLDPVEPDQRYHCNGSRWCKAGTHDRACLAVKDQPAPPAPGPQPVDEPVDRSPATITRGIPTEFGPVVQQALLNLVLQGGVVAGPPVEEDAGPTLANRQLLDQQQHTEREYRRFLIRRGYDPVDLSRWEDA